MKPAEVSMLVTSADASKVDVRSIRMATRSIRSTSGFGNPSLEFIRFRFTEVKSDQVRIVICEIQESTPEHAAKSIRRIVEQTASLLSEMLHGKYKVIVDIREVGRR